VIKSWEKHNADAKMINNEVTNIFFIMVVLVFLLIRLFGICPVFLVVTGSTVN